MDSTMFCVPLNSHCSVTNLAKKMPYNWQMDVCEKNQTGSSSAALYRIEQLGVISTLLIVSFYQSMSTYTILYSVQYNFANICIFILNTHVCIRKNSPYIRFVSVATMQDIKDELNYTRFSDKEYFTRGNVQPSI